jgi:hypothetical protein
MNCLCTAARIADITMGGGFPLAVSKTLVKRSNYFSFVKSKAT